MRRVWLLVNFVVLLVKLVFVGGFIALVVVRDGLVSELSHNYDNPKPETPENTAYTPK